MRPASVSRVGWEAVSFLERSKEAQAWPGVVATWGSLRPACPREGLSWLRQAAGPRSGSGGRREARAAWNNKHFVATGPWGPAAERIVGAAQSVDLGGLWPALGADDQGGLPVSPGLVEGGGGPFCSLLFSTAPQGGGGRAFLLQDVCPGAPGSGRACLSPSPVAALSPSSSARTARSQAASRAAGGKRLNAFCLLSSP